MLFGTKNQTAAAAAADADPRTTPPGASRIIDLDAPDSRHLPIKSVAFYGRVKNGADAVVGAGTFDVQVYVFDDSAGLWVLVGAKVVGVAKDVAASVAVPTSVNRLRVFLQVTNIAGAAADHVDLFIAPSVN